MLCEMCGKEVEATEAVRIEGSVLSVCPACRPFGTPLTPAAPSPTPDAVRSRPAPPSRPVPRPRSTVERDLFAELPEMELADDWFRRIRMAREQHQWTPEEFGKKLNEKKSVVLKMEAGSFRPPDATVRKIEQLLRIRLRAAKSEEAE